MAKKRQIVLQNAEQGDEGLEPLGTPKEVASMLSRFNTAPDGRPAKTGTDIFHGPGFVLELPRGLSRLTQAMVTVEEEDFAFPVLSRLCRNLGWVMVDIESGRKFGG